MLGMDAKSVVVDSNSRLSQDEYKNADERNLIDVTLSIEASRILFNPGRASLLLITLEQNERPDDVVRD